MKCHYGQALYLKNFKIIGIHPKYGEFNLWVFRICIYI